MGRGKDTSTLFVHAPSDQRYPSCPPAYPSEHIPEIRRTVSKSFQVFWTVSDSLLVCILLRVISLFVYTRVKEHDDRHKEERDADEHQLEGV